jgi:glc operon protein GlcG
MRLPVRQIRICTNASTRHACLIWRLPINLLNLTHGLRVARGIKSDTRLQGGFSMRSSKLLAAATAVSFAFSGQAFAQTPAAPAPAAPAKPAPYGAPLTLEMAKKAMVAAEAEAMKNGWEVAISIVDSGGHLVAFSKIDNTQHASIDIATGKAKTAVNLRRPTKALQDSLAPGPTGAGTGVRILSVPGVMPLEGGVPILKDGKIIGGIGVSGVLSSQDAEVAIAGANTLK